MALRVTQCLEMCSIPAACQKPKSGKLTQAGMLPAYGGAGTQQLPLAQGQGLPTQQLYASVQTELHGLQPGFQTDRLLLQETLARLITCCEPISHFVNGKLAAHVVSVLDIRQVVMQDRQTHACQPCSQPSLPWKRLDFAGVWVEAAVLACNPAARRELGPGGVPSVVCSSAKGLASLDCNAFIGVKAAG